MNDAEITSEMVQVYHSEQITALVEAGVDVVTVLRMSNVEESIGIVQACVNHGLPVIVSPTVETDCLLPDKNELKDLIQRIDEATNSAPLFYMVNCAHPSQIIPILDKAKAAGDRWLSGFRGFRANASRKSHEELDNSPELDRGGIEGLALVLEDMQRNYELVVVGGCCGTDHEHIQTISRCLSNISEMLDK